MRKFRLLIVDDDKIGIDIVKNIFEDTHEIFVVTNSEDVVKVIPKVRPDLILLDILMPNLDGFEVMKLIKANPEMDQIPIILITSESDEKSIQKGLKLGAVDYITKPFSIKKIMESVSYELSLLNI